MTKLHEDIIVDLLPLYFAGEASAASGALIEAYFAEHPQFAKAARLAQQSSIVMPAVAVSSEGTLAIKRIRSLLRWRAALIALAIFCTISPFSFFYNDNRLHYFMWRDSPAMALTYAAVAAAAWIAAFLLGRRTSTA
jgi:hypothetical protein